EMSPVSDDGKRYPRGDGQAAQSSSNTGASLGETAKGIADDAKMEALNIAESGKEAVAEQLDDVARVVHRSGEQLEGHQDWMAKLVERGADQLGSLATTLRTNDLQGLFGRIEGVEWRQRASVAGASIAAGF